MRDGTGEEKKPKEDPGFLQIEHWVAFALDPHNREEARAQGNSDDAIGRCSYRDLFEQAKPHVNKYIGKFFSENTTYAKIAEAEFENCQSR